MKKIRHDIKKIVIRGAITVRSGLDKLRDDTVGMGTVEVILIVAVLVALALLFKTFITRYAGNMFDKLDQKTGEAFSDW